MPERLFSQVLAFQSDRRAYQYADPEKSCVPLLVTTCTWAPVARPYSAW